MKTIFYSDQYILPVSTEKFLAGKKKKKLKK